MAQKRTSLASAAWADRHTVERSLSLRPGDFWLGRSDTDDAVPLGFSDDRHICLTCGNRGGKGTSIIVNNLCGWKGSVVVIDPKGENATLTACRRGNGSARVKGLGQKVYVLDPFASSDVPPEYRAAFNPLDALDPADENMSILAGEIANALVLQSPDAKDSKFFDESARAMLKALILHVRTSVWFDDYERNLLTVRNLLMRGAWWEVEGEQERQSKLPKEERKRIPSAQVLLWKQVRENRSCGNILLGYGATFGDLLRDAPETYEGAKQTARTNTDFIEDAAMSRQLEATTPGFALGNLKDDPKGISVYLSLPDDFMDTHSRWLRMMITLTIGACRKIEHLPRSGQQILMVLDEFAGLQRMAIIENAVAKIAGYGLKMFFVLQSLEQLKRVYPDGYHTFLANCGVNIFFGISRLDLFTAKHVSESIGETEIVRVTRSITLTNGVSVAENETYTVGQSLTTSRNSSVAQARQRGWTNSRGETLSRGEQGGTSKSFTDGINASVSEHWGQTTGITTTTGTSKNSSSGPGGPSSGSGSNESVSVSSSTTRGGGRSSGWSQSTTNGVSEGWSKGVSDSITGGTSGGTSETETTGGGSSEGMTYSQAVGLSRTLTESVAAGFTESLHVRPLLQPSEINVLLRRVTNDQATSSTLPDYEDQAYPGLALVMIDGENPCLVRRANYHEDPCFVGYFEKHPHHPFPKTRAVEVPLDRLRRRFYLGDKEPMTVEWLAAPGDRVLRGATVAHLSATSQKHIKRLPIVAVNDGVFDNVSCADGEHGPAQPVSYRLLTSERTPRPDVEATDWVPASSTNTLIMLAVFGAVGIAALAYGIASKYNPDGLAAFLHRLLLLFQIAAAIFFVVFVIVAYKPAKQAHSDATKWWDDNVPAWLRSAPAKPSDRPGATVPSAALPAPPENARQAAPSGRRAR